MAPIFATEDCVPLGGVNKETKKKGFRQCCCPCWVVSDYKEEGAEGHSWCETEVETHGGDDVDNGHCVETKRIPDSLSSFEASARGVLNAAFAVKVGKRSEHCPDTIETDEECCACTDEHWKGGEGPAEQVDTEPIEYDKLGRPTKYKSQFLYDVCMENGGAWRSTHGFAVYFEWKSPDKVPTLKCTFLSNS